MSKHTSTDERLVKDVGEFSLPSVEVYSVHPNMKIRDLVDRSLSGQIIAYIKTNYILKADVVEAIDDWCQCENGYVVTGGMAMEDDLVESMPCEDCSSLRESLNLEGEK